MSTHMQRVLNPRNRSTSLDVEREKWQNSQLTGISKAINNIESPVKEKHMRTVIIGTFQTKSAHLFWSIVRNLQLQENPIVCWKFCHVLHKLLREGHRKTIPDSYSFRSMILDLGKMWGLLREGYGRLIQNYCSLLIKKIDFHANNQRFPGNLMVTDQELESIGENDVNILFQLCCEIFDYLDEILNLQTNVFGSLDMSRSNSMTNAGQCRLAPLIPCIQDSSQLYDYSVKVLFKLHAVLPPGTLDGHRHRFLNQFNVLKGFYENCNHLQYFKGLIQVPLLPKEPPNFLIQSDLDSHVTPVCILPKQPESPEVDQIDMNLVDLSFNEASEKSDDSQSIWSLNNEHRNDNFSANVIEEKDRVIHTLGSRIEQLELQMQRIKDEDVKLIGEYKRMIAELECARAHSIEKEIEALKELEKQKTNNDLEAVNKVAEKYNKMKDFYNKLRAEHIELIRNKADVDKHLTALKLELSQTENLKNTLEFQLREHVKKEAEFSSMSADCNELKLQIQENEIKLKRLEDDIVAQKRKIKEQEWHLLAIVINESQKSGQRTREEEIRSSSVSVNCSPEYFFNQLEKLRTSLNDLEESSALIPTNHSIESLISNVLVYYFQMCFAVNCAKVTYLTIPNIELGQELLNNCKELIDLSANMSSNLKNRLNNTKGFDSVKQCLNKLISMNVSIIPELSDKTKDLAKLLMDEISEMDKAINDAVLKIEQMLEMAKKKDTGIKLEVNGQILDACNYLMGAIKQLIHDAKELQKEIVSQGKGSTSPNEFYQRNHRWTEGLISAAKVVAADAKLLVDSADKVILGSGKFEELIAASQEIAGASAQLVVASRVKADPSSSKMSKLSQSSKRVSEATGNVVAITKKCSQRIEDAAEEFDFSKLSLHQAKRLEMDSQVRVLELENALEKERVKLASLRKQHYHLAGASAGWQ